MIFYSQELNKINFKNQKKVMFTAFSRQVKPNPLFSISQRKFSAAWLNTQLQRIQANSPDKTVAVVVHQSQIRSGELDKVILPEGLSSSSEFRKDLNMGNAYWFYNRYGNENEMKRVLLL